MSDIQEDIFIEHKVMTLLDNFQCPLDHITLSPYLSIVRVDVLSEDEQQVFAGSRSSQNLVHFDAKGNETHRQTFNWIAYRTSTGEVIERTLERANHVLRWHFKDHVKPPLGKYYTITESKWKFDQVVSALRILHSGTVGLFPHEDFYFAIPGFEKVPRSTQRAADGYQLSNPTEIEPYILQAEEVDTLRQLSEVLGNITQPGFLTALSRLDNQYTRTHLTDRLIDAVIALEALYAGESMTEISFRAALRLAAHLGGADADRREYLFLLFHTAYNLRSRLVHGGMHHTGEIEKEVVKKGWTSSEAFMAELDDTLRQALRYILLYVPQQNLKDGLHPLLDKTIKRGEPFIHVLN